MSLVLDASVALTWCFADEATSKSVALLNKLETELAYVPAIWSLELGNILVTAERHKRISYANISQFIELISNLNIQVDSETDNRAFHETLTLAHSEKLTTYDASYLELAMRLGMQLATKDAQLAKAAKRLGVEIININ